MLAVHRFDPTRHALIAWLLLSVATLCLLATASVDRTQEGRVLETARQMSNTGLTGHLIPQLNGRLRLQKPPLAYWMANASFAALGTSLFAGRLPFAVIALLTAGLNYRIARHYFGHLAGLVAMSGVLGCVLGARFALLAETDQLSAFFATAAAYGFWRGVDAPAASKESIGWFYVAASATGFGILSKGPPAAFPFLFFLAYVCCTRRWRSLWTWARCGAVLVIAAIGLPWFAYVTHAVSSQVFAKELMVATMGGAHTGTVGTYFVYLAVDSMPWTPIAMLGVVAGALRMRRDRRLLALLLWFLAILIPFCLAGQKQRHYLVTLVPPLMLLVAWCASRIVRFRPASLTKRFSGMVISAWWIGLLLLGPAALVIGRMSRHEYATIDVIVAIALPSAAWLVWNARRRGGGPLALATFAVIAGPLVLLVQFTWLASLTPVTADTIAASLDAEYPRFRREFAGRESLPLQFALRGEARAMPDGANPEHVIAIDAPKLLIEVNNPDSTPPQRPQLELIRTYQWDDKIVRVFVAEPRDTSRPDTLGSSPVPFE